jgi:hypothetical protein
MVPVGVCVTVVSTGWVLMVREMTVCALAPVAVRAMPRAVALRARNLSFAVMESLRFQVEGSTPGAMQGFRRGR